MQHMDSRGVPIAPTSYTYELNELWLKKRVLKPVWVHSKSVLGPDQHSRCEDEKIGEQSSIKDHDHDHDAN